MGPYTLIAGYQEVLAAFGLWPSFDEAEVLRMLLDRTRVDTRGIPYPSIELELRAWHLLQSGPGEYVFDGKRSSVIHFLFEQVYDVQLGGLNHQNVLSSLRFRPIEDRPWTASSGLGVQLEECFGLSGCFKAGSAKVLAIKPCGAAGTA